MFKCLSEVVLSPLLLLSLDLNKSLWLDILILVLEVSFGFIYLANFSYLFFLADFYLNGLYVIKVYYGLV